MYKATVRAMVRRGIRQLNEGDASFLVKLAAPDAELAFPGTTRGAGCTGRS
jgi:hypothetical protein